MTMKEKVESILEAAFSSPDDTSWCVCECKFAGDQNGVELSGYSPEGENIIISLCGETLGDLYIDALNAWSNFDAEEHTAEILIAKRTGDANARRFYAAAPDSLHALLQDAEAIDKIHERVYEALHAAAKENGEVA